MKIEQHNIKQLILDFIKSNEKHNQFNTIEEINYKNEVKNALTNYNNVSDYLNSFPLFNYVLKDIVYYFGGNYSAWNSLADYQGKLNNMDLSNLKENGNYVPRFMESLNLKPNNDIIYIITYKN